MNAISLMLDGNVANLLAEDPDLRGRLQTLIERAVVRFHKTYVQDVEIANTPDPGKRAALHDALPNAGTVDPAIFILDQPNLDGARFGSPEGEALYQDVFAKKNPKHTRDGIIAVTAREHGHVLVTKDDRLRKKALASGMAVWSLPDFVAFIQRETATESTPCEGKR